MHGRRSFWPINNMLYLRVAALVKLNYFGLRLKDIIENLHNGHAIF